MSKETRIATVAPDSKLAGENPRHAQTLAAFGYPDSVEGRNELATIDKKAILKAQTALGRCATLVRAEAVLDGKPMPESPVEWERAVLAMYRRVYGL